ncbi:MAG: hypothetical protein CM1200mP2_40820 [Planctomycetaceae bacterium]|nr:MAG: hypothetical protein CM1200mP2_40820 [Planctomycetaceae bacterium]
MPHFGTFGLNTNSHGETELHFVSKTISELRLRRSQSGQHQPSTAWIDHWESNPPSAKRRAALSLKRRLSVDISTDTGLDLRTTFLTLWDLVETITGIMTSSGVEIRGAKRGVMKPQSPNDSSRYEFRTYKRLRDRLPALPAPHRPPNQPVVENEADSPARNPTPCETWVAAESSLPFYSSWVLDFDLQWAHSSRSRVHEVSLTSLRHFAHPFMSTSVIHSADFTAGPGPGADKRTRLPALSGKNKKRNAGSRRPTPNSRPPAFGSRQLALPSPPTGSPRIRSGPVDSHQRRRAVAALGRDCRFP